MGGRGGEREEKKEKYFISGVNSFFLSGQYFSLSISPQKNKKRDIFCPQIHQHVIGVSESQVNNVGGNI